MQVGDRVRLKEGWLHFMDRDKYPLYGAEGIVIRRNVPPEESQEPFINMGGKGEMLEVRWAGTNILALVYAEQVQSIDDKLIINPYVVGDRVRFKNEVLHRAYPNFYPPVGTRGTVTAITGAEEVSVKWKRGSTSLTDEWMAHISDIELRGTLWQRN